MLCSNVSPGDNNFVVAVRVRPENEVENGSHQKQVVKVLDSRVLCFDPSVADSVGVSPKRRKGVRPVMQRRARNLCYAFDHVFDQGAQQTEVFEKTTKYLIDGVLTGMNATAFAYGATGAGKTHTMLGTEEQPGVMVLTIEEMFARMEANKNESVYDVEVSYLEVYNETIRDLLQPSRDLPLREDPEKGMVVVGLSVHSPKSAEDLFGMLAYGNMHRTQHPTDANACSSRSHAVFTIYVTQRSRTASINTEIRRGKLLLIDLAGSERATATSNKGSRMREGANINKSLLALGNCINALVINSNSRAAKNHVPYRDSKLTRLLKDALGGNSRTVMIANISPSAMWYEDTHNTLKYANRAKSIKVKAVANVLEVRHHVGQYAELVDSLRQEVVELKHKLAKYEAQGGASANGTAPLAQGPPQAQSKPLAADQLKALEASIRAALTAKGETLTERGKLEKAERLLLGNVARVKLLTAQAQTLDPAGASGSVVARLGTELREQTGELYRVRRLKEKHVAALQKHNATLQHLTRKVVTDVDERNTQWALLELLSSTERHIEEEYLLTKAKEMAAEQDGCVRWQETLTMKMVELISTLWASVGLQTKTQPELLSQYTQVVRSIEAAQGLSPVTLSASGAVSVEYAPKKPIRTPAVPVSVPVPVVPAATSTGQSDSQTAPTPKLKSIIKSSPARKRSPLSSTNVTNAAQPGAVKKKVTFGANVYRSPIHKPKRTTIGPLPGSRSPRRLTTPAKTNGAGERHHSTPNYLADTASFRVRQEITLRRMQPQPN